MVGDDDKYRIKREHFEKLLASEQHPEVAQRILEELFFVEVKNAFYTNARTNHDNTQEVYLSEKRLTHPKCFARYFLFKIPTNEFADETIETLIETWNSASDAEDVANKHLREYHEAGQLASVLEKLRIFRKLLSAKQVPAIVRALSRTTSELSNATTELVESERYLAERFLLSIISDCADPEELEAIVQDAVRRINSFPFLVSFVYQCARHGSERYDRIYEKVNISALRKLASDRLSEHYIQNEQDIFVELSGHDLGVVLYHWATNWRTDIQDNREPVQNYILGLIDLQPARLGALLLAFRSYSISASGKHTTLDYVGFEKAFQPAVFHERLLKYGDAALTNAESQGIAKLFRERFDVDSAKA